MNPRTLLEDYGINPRKSLGQNFMHDPNTLEKIVASADVMPDDTVVEIGPGTGELTVRLAAVARHVVAIELDDRLIPILEDRLEPYPNVYLVHNDVLRTDIPQLVGAKPYVVVANVPYYITTAILTHLFERQPRPSRVVMTMQYEVAERIVAQPGDMSLLAVSVQYYGQPRIISRLNPAVFWPRPGVDSAVLRIDSHSEPVIDVPDEKLFFRVVKAGFSMKRKQLKNSLGGGMGVKASVAAQYLEAADIAPNRRAETLSLEEWAALTRVVAEMRA